LRDIACDELANPTDIVACDKPAKLFVSDISKACIWQIVINTNALDDSTKIKQFAKVANVQRLSVTSDGKLVALNETDTRPAADVHGRQGLSWTGSVELFNSMVRAYNESLFNPT